MRITGGGILGNLLLPSKRVTSLSVLRARLRAGARSLAVGWAGGAIKTAPKTAQNQQKSRSFERLRWCTWWDLNPHAFLHGNLNPACLPFHHRCSLLLKFLLACHEGLDLIQTRGSLGEVRR